MSEERRGRNGGEEEGLSQKGETQAGRRERREGREKQRKGEGRKEEGQKGKAEEEGDRAATALNLSIDNSDMPRPDANNRALLLSEYQPPHDRHPAHHGHSLIVFDRDIYLDDERRRAFCVYAFDDAFPGNCCDSARSSGRVVPLRTRTVTIDKTRSAHGPALIGQPTGAPRRGPPARKGPTNPPQRADREARLPPLATSLPPQPLPPG